MLKVREFAQPQSGFSLVQCCGNALLRNLGACVVRCMRPQATTSTLNEAICHCHSSGSVLYQPRAATCFREGWISQAQSPFLLRIPSTVSAASSLSPSSSETSISTNHACLRWPVVLSVHRSEAYARLYHARWALCLERLF